MYHFIIIRKASYGCIRRSGKKYRNIEILNKSVVNKETIYENDELLVAELPTLSSWRNIQMNTERKKNLYMCSTSNNNRIASAQWCIGVCW
jgi:hypothetical protein